MIHPTVVFRRELVEKYGGYRAEPCWPEDYELWLRWMHYGVQFAKVPEVLFTWRDSAQRLSRTDSRYCEEAFAACKAAYLAMGPLFCSRRAGILGAGRVSRHRAEMLREHGIEIVFYVDVAAGNIGTRIGGKLVLAPAQLDAAPDVPLLACVGNRGAREQIRAFLACSRYVEGKNFWCVA